MSELPLFGEDRVPQNMAGGRYAEPKGTKEIKCRHLLSVAHAADILQVAPRSSRLSAGNDRRRARSWFKCCRVRTMSWAATPFLQPRAVGIAPFVGSGAHSKIVRVRRVQWVGCESQMGVDAGPAILRCNGRHGGTNRVEIDVAHHGEQIALGFDQAGFEATLPERAVARMTVTEGLDVVLADATHGPGDGAEQRRSQQQMEVIVRQLERVKLDRMLAARNPQKSPEVISIVDVREDGATILAALGNV